jgi:aspartate racemase
MIIGIVGGMGSFATLDIFARFLEAFPAEKEWDRPRIIIDNNCTMPSRVRAILYGEKREELIDALSASATNMIMCGATRIIFACNTSHVFVDDVMKKVPQLEGRFVNLITKCGQYVNESCIEEVYLMATEGTIDSGVYDKEFSKYNITLNKPNKDGYSILRRFIEAVKQNHIDEKTIDDFYNYVEAVDCGVVIIGCTELPVLYLRCVEKGYTFSKKIIDPVQIVIDSIRKEYEGKKNEYS